MGISFYHILTTICLFYLFDNRHSFCWAFCLITVSHISSFEKSLLILLSLVFGFPSSEREKRDNSRKENRPLLRVGEGCWRQVGTLQKLQKKTRVLYLQLNRGRPKGAWRNDALVCGKSGQLDLWICKKHTRGRCSAPKGALTWGKTYQLLLRLS